MDLGLKDKCAFIAGSSGGIGQAIAWALAREGCTVVLCARRVEALAALAADIREACNVPVHYVAANLDSATEISRVIEETKRFVQNIDVLVTNNGGPPPGEFETLDEAQWELGWNRTLMSTVRLIRGFLPDMKYKQWGRIINVTSISVKQPIQRLLLSNAYRAAVTGMAKTLSNEVARFGITVNNVAPGFTETARYSSLLEDRAEKANTTVENMLRLQVESVPAQRIGKPEELASLAAYLASESAGYITGVTIPVDGGLDKGLL